MKRLIAVFYTGKILIRFKLFAFLWSSVEVLSLFFLVYFPDFGPECDYKPKTLEPHMTSVEPLQDQVSQVAKLTHHSVAAVWQAQHQQDEPSPLVDFKNLRSPLFRVRSLRNTGGGSSSNLGTFCVVTLHLDRNVNAYTVI